MKLPLILLCAAGAVFLSSCCSQTTLENRRDLYFPQKVNGPYTRMLHEGIPSPEPVKGEVTVTDGKAVVGK